MHDFAYNALPGRVVFGAGAVARIGDELTALGGQRVLIITTGSNRKRAESISQSLGDRSAGVYDDALPHVPIEQAEAARETAKSLGADSLISIGGGSPVGLAKAIAHALEIPTIAVPTTYSGSEMTSLVGMTRDAVKRTVSGPAILPKTVIYDPELTYDLPATATAATGMNAVAHCVEATYVSSANPVSTVLAETGLRALASGLPAAVRDGQDKAARDDALYGAYLAGAALGATGIAIHHKVCHVLGGSFGIAHGDANAIMLSQAVKYNTEVAAGPIAGIARALGASDSAGDDRAAQSAAPFLYDFAASMGAPVSLKAVGLPHESLDKAAEISVELITDNPRPVDYESVRALLEDAWAGTRPGA